MKTLILGLGISGKSVYAYLQGQGKEILCVDKNASTLKQDPFFAGATLKTEGEASLEGVECIVKSPGISWEHPLLREAKEKNIVVTSEMDLALNAIQSKGKTLFAITGSNGKTTTTLLTTHILNKCGKKAVACGNVGVPLLSEIDNPADIFVVELSSFQLETLHNPVFSAACILNITPNHLDRYETFHEYAKTKFRLQFLLKKEGKLFLSSEMRMSFDHLIDPQIKEKVATISPLSYRVGEKWIAPHDLENLRAAAMLTAFANCGPSDFWKAFSSFVKPPHRIEFVRTYLGVRYVNDSKATSTDAVCKAIESVQEPVILIAGGLDKKGDFKSLVPLLQKRVRKVLLIGKDALKIKSELEGAVEIEIAETLNCALVIAEGLAKEGECVLFSPGCASYDQFRNYEHRGDVFKQLVKELGEKKL